MIKNNAPKFIWLSANLFGYEVLKEVLRREEVEVSGIITLSSKSKVEMYDGIFKDKWYELGVPVYEIEDINKEEDMIKSLNPDFIVMAGWRQMISKSILEIPTRGFIGFHPALLPKGRGSAPIINTIMLGLKESGVTMFYLGEGVDNGDIIGQAKFNISNNDYAVNLYEKVIKGAKELIKFLPLLVDGNAPRTPQKEEDASYFPKRSLKDNEINLNETTPEEALKKIRAFSEPYSGAYVKINNKKIIIWQAQIEDEKK